MTFPDAVANALCLELVNTVNSWHAPTRDALANPASARAWVELVAGGLEQEPDDQALGRARELRQRLHETFRAIARDESPSGDHLAGLEEAYAVGVATARLRPASGAYELSWPNPGGLDDLIARVAASAVDLLTRGPLERVGECPSCGWLFLDTSRNGSRRWCSMDTCGARVKARRHYASRSDPIASTSRPDR